MPAILEFVHITPQAKLRQLRALARLMDESIPIPGTTIKLGLDSLVGFIPGVGDLIGAALSAYIIREASQMGVPKMLVARMVANAAIDLFGGAVPVVGDLFDVAWKANMKNVDLLEAHLKAKDPAAWA
jgi:hypothetical protein